MVNLPIFFLFFWPLIGKPHSHAIIAFVVKYSNFFSYECSIDENSNKTIILDFLPFEMNSVTMKNTTIFTVTGFCKMNYFPLFPFSSRCILLVGLSGRETDSRTRQFLSILQRTFSLYSEKAVHKTAGFKAIPIHLSVPLRHSGGGLLWFKSLI